MVNEYTARKTLEMFFEIVVKLISPNYKPPRGGKTIMTILKALNALERKYNDCSTSRIVDYVVSITYRLKNLDGKWNINTAFGPKSLEKYHTNKALRYYEDKWLSSQGLSRTGLLTHITDFSNHPFAKYIYMPSEEASKSRLLNQEVGYFMCQSNTLGWSPESKSCSLCKFTENCKRETNRKFPELYRIRTEYNEKRKS